VRPVKDAVGQVFEKLCLSADVLDGNDEVGCVEGVEGFGSGARSTTRAQAKTLAPNRFVVNAFGFANRERDLVAEI
jgi:hypothetical protein